MEPGPLEDELNTFIVRAKANTYVGGAAKSPSCRPGSHDLHPHLISAAQAGHIIQASLSQTYQQGRILGGFEYRVGDSVYTDTSAGTVTSFTGQEWITRQGQRVYQLVYHGGLVID